MALVLAAGTSTRFGCDKRQARLPDGRSLLEAVVATHREAMGEVLDDVWVLTRPGDTFAAAVCARLGARCVVCEDAAQGQGRTLADGLRHLQADPGVAAALVSLADMPWVRADTLRRLCAGFAAHGGLVLPRLAASFGQPLGAPHGPPGSAPGSARWGHPRVLPRAVWPRLLGQEGSGGSAGLQGDRGAQALLDWSSALHIDVDDPGVLRDADTPEDLLAHLRAQPPAEGPATPV